MPTAGSPDHVSRKRHHRPLLSRSSTLIHPPLTPAIFPPPPLTPSLPLTPCPPSRRAQSRCGRQPLSDCHTV